MDTADLTAEEEGVELQGQETIVEVLRTSVCTTVPDVTVEKTRPLDVTVSEATTTHEKRAKKAVRATSSGENFIARRVYVNKQQKP